MTADAIFWDGFDTLGPAGTVLLEGGVENPGSTLFASEWTSVWLYSATFTAVTAADMIIDVVDSLAGPGQALRIANVPIAQAGALGISKTLPASFERVIFGGLFRLSVMHAGFRQAVVFGDGSSDQVGICFNASGQIEVRRGASTDPAVYNGTLLATSDESVTTDVAFSLKGDITFGASDGIVRIWLEDQLTSLDLSGINTQNTANASANTVRLMLNQLLSAGSHGLIVDSFYLQMFTAAGSGDAVPPSSLVVETQFPTGDDAIDFAVGAAILGPDYSETDATNAPGANQLLLRKYTPDADGTLDSVTILPEASSVTAKFKAAAYADSAGAPGALLSDGVEVVGCTAGVALTSDLVTPYAFSAGAPVWIGVYGDSAVELALTDGGVEGRRVARTYGSGAPNPAGAMTANQPSWVIFGVASGVTDAWSVVDNNPFAAERSYMVSSNVGDKDLFTFPALSSTPTAIYGIKVMIVGERADAGARTVDLITKSAAATDAGDNPGVTPPTTWGSRATYQRVDPDTAAAWNASGANLAKHGYEIAS